MKTFVVLLFWLFATVPAWGATKTVQITGPVYEIRDDAIVIGKGKEKWEIGRDVATKIKGELRKGARVTVEVRMNAATIDVHEERKK